MKRQDANQSLSQILIVLEHVQGPRSPCLHQQGCYQPTHGKQMVPCTPHAKVPVVRTCTLQAGPVKGSMPTYSTHLQRQGRLKPQLPVCCLTLSNSMEPPAVKSMPAANAEAARAEFCRAGIPDEVTTKVLKRYHPYLR
ncbi:hypothetical protein ABBQ38_008654 [Trebouxia sp. C0009 RCD-2024]